MSASRQDTFPQSANRFASVLRKTGIVFLVLGALALVIPAIATVVVEQMIAWLLVFWGIAGVAFALSFRQVDEWRIIAVCFGVVLAVGLGFVVFPGAGAAFLTMLLVAVFLLEGALSILLGLRMSGQMDNWRWIIVSGVCSFILGFIILVQWPDAKQWVLGFLVGLNFLSTGLSLLLVSRVAKQAAPE